MNIIKCMIFAVLLVSQFLNVAFATRIAMIIDPSGINDRSYNQKAYNGLKSAQRKYNVDVTIVETKNYDELRPKMENVSKENYDMIISTGVASHDITRDMARKYPMTKYLAVDMDYKKDEYLPNLVTVSFNETEAGYLVGLLAGSLTNKYYTSIKGLNSDKKLGVIKGMDIPPVNRYADGFEAGVKKACPDCSVVSNNLRSFVDKDAAKKVANSMYDTGVDIIFPVAGLASIGAIDAAKLQHKLIIGIDNDQNYLAPDNIVVSAMKNIDTAIDDMIGLFVANKLTFGKDHLYSIRKDGVGVSEYHGFKNKIPKELQDLIEKSKNDLRNPQK